jgi:hypothetical protein
MLSWDFALRCIGKQGVHCSHAEEGDTSCLVDETHKPGRAAAMSARDVGMSSSERGRAISARKSVAACCPETASPAMLLSFCVGRVGSGQDWR